MIASGGVDGDFIAHFDRRRGDRRAHGRARAVARRPRRHGLRAGRTSRRARRWRADFGERRTCAVRARTGRRIARRVVRTFGQGNPSLEYRRDLEAVRPRRRIGRALRRAVLHDPSRRPASCADRCDASDCARGDPLKCQGNRFRRRRQGRHAAPRERRTSHRRRADRRRRGALAHSQHPRRRRPAGVHRLHGVARAGAGRKTSRAHAPQRRGQLGRAGRPRHQLSAAPRRDFQFRRHRGARLARGILDRARHARGMRRGFPRLACRHPCDHPQHRVAVQMGAARAASR